ncbi:hypothetical protein AALP_AA7G200300 [Arabis alpina]|uniref:Bifunctional inhibitor/plant lipid transfer protein/seed storage helical domain-containing protein n=1 Tax=Arabis alpina TaxID=50452 RepID=A0A087GJB2_ARAAL|nr:hypothetical protein AALP_AA7G200300 [Arabis alpina]
MDSRMIKTLVIVALAFFMISSDNFHLATADQVCGANLSGLVNECQRYIDNAALPSQSCCDLIRPIDVSCACRYVSWWVMTLIDMDKVVSVVRSCGKSIPSGYKCGSYTIPAA